MRIVLSLLCLGVFCSAATAQAASVYLDPGMSDLKLGDSITMAIRLDVDEEIGECINAVDAVITYPETILPVDVSLGQSIFRMWVEEPKIDLERRQVTFAGGIPNGYCGRIAGDPRLTNVIAEIVFTPQGEAVTADTGEVTIAFGDETHAYLNDGRGTMAALRTVPARINVLNSWGGTSNPWLDQVAADTQAPESFSITLTKDPSAFRGKYYIVFNTTDKQTGVDHYDVIEEPIGNLNLFKFGAVTAPWIEARSPYVLEDQTLNSVIRVRAVDHAGNEYVATLVPDESLRVTTPLQVAVFVIALIFLLVIVVTPVLMISKRVRYRNEQKRLKAELKARPETSIVAENNVAAPPDRVDATDETTTII